MEKREIKFRAWHKDKKVMRPRATLTLGGGIDYIAAGQRNSRYTPFSNDFVLMQFTGLLDKNGKEIYEGDILDNAGDEESLMVFFNTSTACFDVEFLGGDCEPMVASDGWYAKDWEIKGNIYENPELLKEATNA